MMPEGWIRTTIAGVSSVPVSYGVVQTGDPVEGGVPCVRVVDIASRDLKRDSMITTSHEISAAYSRTVLKAGDLMIALRGIIGQTAQATRELEGCNLTRGIARISPKAGTVTSDFLLQSLNGPEFKSLINRQANGSALQEISIATLRKAPVLLPPISEQRRIAETLQTWDRAIETVEALIANARAQKQALMQQLLPQGTNQPKKRLPGFSGEWATYRLDELERKNWIELGRGRVISKKDIKNVPGTHPIYSSSVNNGGLFGKYGKYDFDCELISWSVDGGGHFFHRPKHKFSVTNVSGWMKLQEERLNYRFVAAQLQTQHSLLQFDYQLKAHPSVIRKMYHIGVPSLEEQLAIAAFLEDLETETSGFESQLTALRQEKAALMQQLLTGKRRVKLPESEVA